METKGLDKDLDYIRIRDKVIEKSKDLDKARKKVSEISKELTEIIRIKWAMEEKEILKGKEKEKEKKRKKKDIHPIILNKLMEIEKEGKE